MPAAVVLYFIFLVQTFCYFLLTLTLTLCYWPSITCKGAGQQEPLQLGDHRGMDMCVYLQVKGAVNVAMSAGRPRPFEYNLLGINTNPA